MHSKKIPTRLWFPSDSTILHSVNTNGVKNNTITQRDVQLSATMLGPSKHALKGKTTRSQPDAVNVSLQRVDVPRTTRQFHNNVELAADVVFLNDVQFLTTMSEHVHHGTVGPVDNLTCPSLESQIKSVLRSYAVRGFRCVMTSVDPQFKALKDRNVVGHLLTCVVRVSMFT